MITAKEAHYAVLEFEADRREERRQELNLEITVIEAGIRRRAKKGRTWMSHRFEQDKEGIVELAIKKLKESGFGVEQEVISRNTYVRISWEVTEPSKEG